MEKYLLMYRCSAFEFAISASCSAFCPDCPPSSQYHMQHMPWKPLLREAVHLGYYSHNCDTCGLHIHVSRSSFGETTEQQEDVISRLLYFVEKFWSA